MPEIKIIHINQTEGNKNLFIGILYEMLKCYIILGIKDHCEPFDFFNKLAITPPGKKGNPFRV